ELCGKWTVKAPVRGDPPMRKLLFSTVALSALMASPIAMADPNDNPKHDTAKPDHGDNDRGNNADHDNSPKGNAMSGPGMMGGPNSDRPNANDNDRNNNRDNDKTVIRGNNDKTVI